MTTSTLVRPLCKRCGGRVSFEYDLEYHILIGSCISCGNQTYPGAEIYEPEPYYPKPGGPPKKRCRHGHLFTPENTQTWTNPRSGKTTRRCNTCRRLRQRKKRDL